MRQTIKKYYKAVNLIDDKIKLYRRNISINISREIDVKLKNKHWSILLDTWIYYVLSLIVSSLITNKVKRKFNHNSQILCQNYINNTFDIYKNYKILVKTIHNIINKKKKIKLKIINSHNNINIVSIFFHYICKLYIYLRNPILITDGYFSFKTRVNLFFLSYGKILIIDSKFIYINKNKYIYNTALREKLSIKCKDNVDFIFNLLIKNLFPTTLLENIKLNFKESIFYLNNIRKLGTAINMHTNDLYKILAVNFMLNKKKLFHFQHGSGYKFLKKNIKEKIEVSNCDKYFFWNNKYGIGLNHLSRFKILKKEEINKNKYIYFFLDALTSELNYFDHTILYRKPAQSILNNLKKFIFLFKKKNYLYFKLLEHDKFFINKLIDCDVKVEKDKNVKKILQSARIFVSNVFSTSAIEALYCGIPTVLILEKNLRIYGFNDDILDILRTLKPFGFIQHDFSEASLFISKIYHNIDDWWYNIYFQKNIKLLAKKLFTYNNSFTKDLNLILQK